MAFKSSWSFSCISARRAARVGEVSRPRSISASETEFACGTAAAERHFLAGVPHLDFQVMAVQCLERLAGQEAEPEERRHRRLGDVFPGTPGDLDDRCPGARRTSRSALEVAGRGAAGSSAAAARDAG